MIKPMLAHVMPEWMTVTDLVENPNWGMQQKLDGARMIIQVINREARAYNRKGEECFIYPQLAANFDIPAFDKKWQFDGEFMNDCFYVFDILHCEKSSMNVNNTFSVRRFFLNEIFERWTPPHVSLVPTWTDPDEKRKKLAEAFTNNLEGVMFKRLDGRYHQGKRTFDTVKYKFVKTADVMVCGTNRGRKERSVTVGMFHEGKMQECCGLKIPDELVGIIKPGNVIEVNYLYGTKDFKLYQPTFKRVRTDKVPAECRTDQIEMTNKEYILEA